MNPKKQRRKKIINLLYRIGAIVLLIWLTQFMTEPTAYVLPILIAIIFLLLSTWVLQCYPKSFSVMMWIYFVINFVLALIVSLAITYIWLNTDLGFWTDEIFITEMIIIMIVITIIGMIYSKRNEEIQKKAKEPV